MNERRAFAQFRLELLEQLEHLGYDTVQVLAGRQPTNVGRVDNSVYFFSIGEGRQTTQGRTYSPQPDGTAGHVEEVRVLKTLQIQTYKQTDLGSYEDTAGDLCGIVHMIVQSMRFTEGIRNRGLAISSITPIREPEFINEHGQYEKAPSFDLDLGFERSLTPTTAWIDQAQIKHFLRI